MIMEYTTLSRPALAVDGELCQWRAPGLSCKSEAVHVMTESLPVAPAGVALCAWHSPYDHVDHAPYLGEYMDVWQVNVYDARDLVRTSRLRYVNLSDANEAAQSINGSSGPRFAMIVFRRVARYV